MFVKRLSEKFGLGGRMSFTSHDYIDILNYDKDNLKTMYQSKFFLHNFTLVYKRVINLITNL